MIKPIGLVRRKIKGNCLLCKYKDLASGSEGGFCWDCSKENSKWKRAKCLPIPTKKKKKVCEWKLDYFDDDYYETGCNGDLFQFNEGGLKENGVKYCPYCGLKIKLVKGE